MRLDEAITICTGIILARESQTVMNQITPEERAAIVREKEKANSSIVILAAGMAIWAGSVIVKGGYTTQPEHHDLWRMVALLPAIWGIVLLIIFRYSWTSLIAAIVMAVSGFYLANAPTVPGYVAASTDSRHDQERPEISRPSPRRPQLFSVANLPSFNNLSDDRDSSIADERRSKLNEVKSLLNFCREIQHEKGEEWTSPRSLEEAPCSIEEMEERRAQFKQQYYRRHPELVRNQ